MSLSCSNNKSKRKTTFRRSSVAQKRNRRSSKARNKPKKKKFTVMVKEGRKAVASTSYTAPVVETVKEDFNPEIDVNHHDIHCHNIGEPDRTFVIEQQDNGVVKVDRINSQIKKSIKHTDRTSQAAKSCPKMPCQTETSKAEALKKRFDVMMSTHDKLVADHFILKMQFQHLIDVFGSSIDDVLKVVKDRGECRSHGDIAKYNDGSNVYRFTTKGS
ncbi:hypothetical protein Adt_35327 [Abeliophyllum distichum]|uniref:Uncharacterized protein n=1 Tax=Abeliophyllum distichum TaxID=126358 RepID=A0ABD1QEE0_9LAMI